MSEVIGKFPSVDKIQKQVDNVIDYKKAQDRLSSAAIITAFRTSVKQDALGLVGSDINTSDWDGGDADE